MTSVQPQPHPQDEAEPETEYLLTRLPDSQTQLYPQNDEVHFSTFTRFGDLPQEIRLLIFKAAMPYRTVQVELSMSYEILHSHTPPPTLLRINRESRYETLKYYIPLLKSSKKRRLILFNPERDTIYFHRRENRPLSFLANTGYITRDSVEGISKIQSLKITDMFYGGAMKCWVLFGVTRRLLYGEGTHPDRGGLRFFSGLRELILETAKRDGDFRFDVFHRQYETFCAERLEGEMVEECKKDFRGYFEWEREWNRSCLVPEIVVREGKDRKLDKWYMGRLDGESDD